ncbi:UNVERIFIED_CONTAM: hypothetical protein H355_013934 [Colinus virginianus]|nr:hypothetical protein H355_013934 [Colinus virginianus]
MEAAGCGIRTALLCSLPTACVLCGRADDDSDILGSKCERDGLCFHVYCAVSALQLLILRPSFCGEHRPQQAVDAVPAPDTTCIICTDPVGNRASYSTMVCPCCQHAWFHRACVQALAAAAVLLMCSAGHPSALLRTEQLHLQLGVQCLRRRGHGFLRVDLADFWGTWELATVSTARQLAAEY